MAKILIYGPSGGGKSSALRNLDHTRTGYINADRKELPFYNWENLYKTVKLPDGKVDYTKSNYVTPKKTISVMEAMKAWELRTDLDNIAVDTITHMMAHDFMKRILETGYTKFSQMGLNVYDILDYIRDTKSEKNFIITAHNDIAIDAAGDKVNKIRSFGKLMDEKVEIPSMFTVVLYAYGKRVNGVTQHFFQTQTDGSTFAKTPVRFKDGKPIHALPEFEMDNDVAIVIDRVNKFRKGELPELIDTEAPSQQP